MNQIAHLPIGILAVFAGILGAIFGSFIGALCSRWPEGRSVITGRSGCESCARLLSAAELVPIFSYLFLQGRCRGCGAAIGKQSLVTELLAAAIGVLAVLFFPLHEAARFAIICWILLPLIILDFQHFWLPNLLLACTALTAIATGIGVIADYDIKAHILSACICFAAMEALRRGYHALRNKDGMGAGDPKLFAALALWVDPLKMPNMLLIASGLGLAFIVFKTKERPLTDEKLPFGSMLALAAILVQLMAAID
jgi:leader peptidase (prepilin peptidase) / N-methyltransferase